MCFTFLSRGWKPSVDPEPLRSASARNCTPQHDMSLMFHLRILDSKKCFVKSSGTGHVIFESQSDLSTPPGFETGGSKNGVLLTAELDQRTRILFAGNVQRNSGNQCRIPWWIRMTPVSGTCGLGAINEIGFSWGTQNFFTSTWLISSKA